MDFERLRKVRNPVLVVSTHGEGEPPYNAEAFNDWLHSDDGSVADKCAVAILALGDSSYKHYCK